MNKVIQFFIEKKSIIIIIVVFWILKSLQPGTKLMELFK
jgi:hypothetical protein